MGSLTLVCEAVLKIVGLKGFVGSNPTLPAKNSILCSGERETHIEAILVGHGIAPIKFSGIERIII